MRGGHTPGPWSVYPYVQHKGHFAIEAKSEGGLRQDVGQTFDVLNGDPLVNARLMATAPDGLELAQDAIPILEVLLEEREEAIGEECEILRDLLKRTREFVAKAEARS